MARIFKSCKEDFEYPALLLLLLHIDDGINKFPLLIVHEEESVVFKFEFEFEREVALYK